MADGLLITGGESVHPSRFGDTFNNLADGDANVAHNLKAGCNVIRDEMEFAAFEEFFKRKKPLWGSAEATSWSTRPWAATIC